MIENMHNTDIKNGVNGMYSIHTNFCLSYFCIFNISLVSY